MFKKLQDLRELEKDQYGYVLPYWQNYNKTLEVAFKSVQERADFYKKYESNFLKLNDEHPKIKLDFKHTPIAKFDKHYNSALFDFCFGDLND
jgi:hypothetical protein